MLMFGWSRDETTNYNSIIVSTTGFIGFAFLLLYVWTKLGKRVDDRIGVFLGLLGSLVFLALTFPWSFKGTTITEQENECSFSWCSTTSAVSPWLYNTLYILLFGVSFPLVNVHLVALFSHLIGPRPQVVAHCIATLISSSSRAVAPLLVMLVFTEHGPRFMWTIELAGLAVVFVLIAVLYRRLIPPFSLSTLPTGKKMKTKQGVVYRF